MDLRYTFPTDNIRSKRVTNSLRWLAILAVIGLLAVLGGSPLSAQGQSFTPAVMASNDCTIIVTAGQSISGAINSAPSGAVVCVRQGVYNEQLRLGASHRGLTLKAYPGEKPVLDGQGNLPAQRYAGLIQIGGTNNITVDGFEVRNSAERGVVVSAADGATVETYGITVRNLYVHHSVETGILVKGNATLGTRNILIENNIVYQNLQKNLVSSGSGSAMVFVQSRDSVARGNTVYNNHGEGIVVDRYATNTLLQNNVAYDNDRASIYVLNTINPVIDGNFVFCTDDRNFWNGDNPNGPMKAGVGMQLRDEDFPPYDVQPPNSRGQVIINNLIVGCSTNFGVATQVNGGGLNNAIVANNTFINARGDAGTAANNVRLAGDASYANTLFVNNILVQNTDGDNLRVLMSLGTPNLSTLTVANNLYWPKAPGSTWFANEPGRLVSDPRIANLTLPVLANLPDPAWYGLTANSPAINSGRPVAQVVNDFFNRARSNPPDRGAIEFMSTGTPGRIRVVVAATPSGSAPLFSFTASFPPAAFQLGTGQTHDFGPLNAGVYRVDMANVPGWSLTAATCSDGSPPSAIALGAGETVTCTFTTTQASQSGTIIVRKETDPPGATQQFSFSTNYGADFQLGHGQTNTSAALSAGTYSVAEASTSGWTLTGATCDDGSSPAAIALAAGETVTCTFRNKEDARTTNTDGLYISARQSGTVDGISYSYNDILALDMATGRWSLYLQLSDVGVVRNLNGFTLMDDGSVLVTMNRNQSIDGLGTVTARDVIRFVPQSTGATTQGTWQWYLDGSDVGLTTGNEAVDTIAITPDGRLVVSTTGTATVPTTGSPLKAFDEDLLVFSPTSLGANTAGTWSLYFDGSTVKGLAVEDVNGAWFDETNSDLYLTVTNNFSIGGVKGTGRDIIRLRPAAGGTQVQKYWYGPDYGFSGLPNAFAIKR